MRYKRLFYMRCLLLLQHLCLLLSAELCMCVGVWLWESGKITALTWQEYVCICIAVSILLSFSLAVFALHSISRFLEIRDLGNPQRQSVNDRASMLLKYKELLDANAITPEEYETIKQTILRQIGHS